MQRYSLNPAARERLHSRAHDAAERHEYTELLVLLGALFPASIVGQAAALYIYTQGRLVYPELQAQCEDVDDSILEKLTHLHTELGIDITISLQLFQEIVTELGNVYQNLIVMGMSSLTLAQLEEAWRVNQIMRGDPDIPRGFLEMNLLSSLQSAQSS